MFPRYNNISRTIFGNVLLLPKKVLFSIDSPLFPVSHRAPCIGQKNFLWFACVGVLISRYLRLLASGVGDSRGLHLYVALDFYKTLSYVTSC